MRWLARLPSTTVESLRQREDFERVRISGRAVRTPLVILTYCSNQQQKTRIGLITSRSFGKANVRNRGRRILRAAIQQLATLLQPGWDIVLIARAPLATSTSAVACLVLKNACQKAGLLRTGIDEKPV
ncbi:MAG TPA: ribonuclease P protein component [Anaerolineales bacterium]|nr:ribonuclease P protein component [Anaerolineales bacterium]